VSGKPSLPQAANAPVLILGASPRVAVPIARSLANIGVKSHVATFSTSEPHIRSRFVAGFHRLPARENSEFADALCSLVQQHGFDMLIPTSDGPLGVMSEHHQRLSALLYLACPQPSIVARVLNKAETLRLAEQCGIPVPKSCVIENLQQVSSLSDFRFPVVIKPRDAKGRGIRVLYAESRDSLLRTLSEKAIGAALVQEFCPGSGVGVEILMHRGEPLAVFQHRRLKEVPPGGGVAVIALAEEPDPKLAAASIELLRALEWEGVAMVEYRYDQATGATGLMEVNGRFWGTTGLPIAAGVDFPVYLWRIAHNQEPGIAPSFRIGTRWRHTPGYVARAHQILIHPKSIVGSGKSRWQELSDIPRDLSPAVHDALWKWSDPFPAIAELLSTIRELVKADAKWILRRIVPNWLLREKDRYRRLGPQAARIYLRLRTFDKLGLRYQSSQRPRRAPRSLVFVCHGNIMRSAMAEVLFRNLAAKRVLDTNISVCSAGVHASPGKPADARAALVCNQSGLSLADHRAQRLTRALVDSADAILVMDLENKAEVLARFPACADKIFMLAAYDSSPFTGREIDDPFLGELADTRTSYLRLRRCVENLVMAMAETVGNKISDSTAQPCSETVETGATVR
jgi:predicted ATP-grasp superfamily ATP-dependent carboligase/protein-tyrosine-phosphatase